MKYIRCGKVWDIIQERVVSSPALKKLWTNMMASFQVMRPIWKLIYQALADIALER